VGIGDGYYGGYYGGYYDPIYGYVGSRYGGYGFGAYSPFYSGIYSGYDPWFGGSVLGSFDSDPWYGGSNSFSSSQGSTYVSGEDSGLRLKVKPRNGEVFVDGYYVGVVNDFDGMFQKLRIEPGPHRIEIRAPGYETLDIDVRLVSGNTTVYSGELKKIQ
jgi:hypothetical protein